MMAHVFGVSEFARRGVLRSVFAARAARLAAGVLLGAGVLATSAPGQIAITAGSCESASNGSSGRRGSSTGPLIDDPLATMGTSGIVTNQSMIHGGPVPAMAPLVTFPGTTCIVDAQHDSFINFQGGPAFMRISSENACANALTDMDGAELSAIANSSGNFDYTFTVTTNTPYSLTGVAAIDNEDVSGSVRMFRGILPLHSVFVANNGPFAFSGTLTPGTYRLLGNTAVTATAGAAGVPLVGAFSESSTVSAVLVLGCIGVLDQPADASICPRAAASFTVDAAGTSTISYSWEVEDMGAPGGWRAISDGPLVISATNWGTVSGTGTPTLTAQPDPMTFTVSPVVRFRVVATNACGNTTSAPATLTVNNCPGDIDGDGAVGLSDIAAIIIDWSRTVPPGNVCSDLDGSGDIGLGDIAAVTSNWGTVCP